MKMKEKNLEFSAGNQITYANSIANNENQNPCSLLHT